MSITSCLSPLLTLPRRTKQALALLIDTQMALVGLWLAFYLRLEQWGWPIQEQRYVYAAVLLFIPIFVRMGLYRAIFRYAGISAVAVTSIATSIYGVLFFVLLIAFSWQGVPRSLGLMQPLVFLLLAGGWRLLARHFLQGLAHNSKDATQKGRLLIYGAGEAGVQTALAMDVMQEFTVCGFVDDDVKKIGNHINRTPIIALESVPAFVNKYGITDILLAMPSLGWQRRRAIISQLQSLPVHVRSLPGMLDLALGKVSVSDFKELDIEDLLGREPVQPDTALLAKNLQGKRVLVTGAGGSIGSELCRQIVLERPQSLVLLEHSEYALYAIHQELQQLCRQHALAVELLPQLASIRNLRRLRAIFQAQRPHSVFHAAAYKHVPLVQSNPAEGIINNVFGTLNAARAAIEYGVDNFVLISTDKAVRPTNVMGASKRMAELVLQALAEARQVDFSAIDSSPQPIVFENRTQFCMVRFGNVLGSSGSVVPLFRQQLRQGGPLTVTHAEVTRYFMTIPEAAQLVLQAGAMGQGGEVFVLDMGQPVKIIDLARRMIELSGLSVRNTLNPSGDVEIKVVGLRPGEKLYEELLIGDNPESTTHPRIMKAHENLVGWQDLVPQLQALRTAARHEDRAGVEQVLTALVSGYTSEAGAESA